jgi:hypothetical protein
LKEIAYNVADLEGVGASLAVEGLATILVDKENVCTGGTEQHVDLRML